MNPDIGPILREWPFDPEKNVRRFTGEDGKARLQVRLPLGLEQYELDGRPDGARPDGEESYLEAYQKRLAQYAREHAGDGGFLLTREDCARLQQEALLYYSRYLLCFQIGDFAQVQRDTERNMRLFRFVHRYAEHEEDRVALDQYWPYIIRMNAMAQALDLIQKGGFEEALLVARRAVARIRELEEVPNETFSFEKARSLAVLDQLVEELKDKAPPEEREIVRDRLQRAVAEENYERAAQLRDLLRSMEE
jgi:hypothetical protein